MYTRKNALIDGRLLAYSCLFVTLLIVSTIAGVYTYVWLSNRSTNELTNSQNTTIIDALKNRPVEILVRDSNRVTSINKKTSLKVLPLKSCTQLNAGDTSTVLDNSFAFLLSYDKHSKSLPSCALKQIVAGYGRPDGSALIVGTLAQPKETLLFYESGTHNRGAIVPARSSAPATVEPIELNQLPTTVCTSTSLNVVAHQDDDLLFLSPDLLHDIQNGNCVRTVYLTAGDAGNSQPYWLSRQHGSQAAYTSMIAKNDDIWIERIVKLADKQYVTVASPKNNQKISLIFMHLPDGNVNGSGFRAYSYQSLAKLASGSIPIMNSVDGQSRYSSDEILSALVTIMNYYQPKIVRTLSTNYTLRDNPYVDHRDHNAAGSYGQAAFKQYGGASTSSLFTYLGYGIHGMAANVSSADYQQKQAAFLRYAKYDGGVCQTIIACESTNLYHYYLAAQYQSNY